MRIETEHKDMQTEPLTSIKKRDAFVWENGQSQTIEGLMQQRARVEAAKKLTTINERIALNSSSVVDKIKPRAATWNITDLLTPYSDLGESPLEKLLELLETKKEDAKTDNDSWVVETLGYEARAASRRKVAAEEEKGKAAKESAVFKIARLKRQPDEKYGDTFNKLVCQVADKMGDEDVTTKNGKGKMATAEQVVKEQTVNELSDTDIEAYLTDRVRQQLETRLQGLYKTGLAKLQDREKAESYTALLFEIDSRKTNEVWQGKRKKLEDAIANGLKGEELNLLAMFCTVNEYDFNGHYTLVPDIFAYQKKDDVQLEPVPLIIDELAQVAQFFQFYGINAPMTIYVADADYIECRECGPVLDSNLQNIGLYLQNLKGYLALKNFPMKVSPITGVTINNPVYEQSKARIWKHVSTMKDPNFQKDWGKAFEEDLQRRIESQKKRKFFPEDEIEQETLGIIKRIWSVNGAQGSFFGSLPGNNILISTERRERDQNYVIDPETRDEFIPVVYILSAADKWTRKVALNKNYKEVV